MNAPIPPVTYCSLGALIRTLRRTAGFSQELLAQRSGLSPDSIRRLENNAFSPTLLTLKKLCAGLGVRLSTLMLHWVRPRERRRCSRTPAERRRWQRW
ncbi:MAG: helix-turn-helix transcriptional regulator [Acidobacteria bacterium]|nr:helix-turn-helix transcriptional regulator [Acidobacteriota bacterium]